MMRIESAEPAMSDSTPSSRPWLTAGQRRLTALAVSAVATLVLIGVLALGVWGLRLFIAAFGHVVWPLVIAGILTVLLRPLVQGMETHLKLTRVRAIILLYFLVVSSCIALGLLLMPFVFKQVGELTHSVPEFIRQASGNLKLFLENHYPDLYQKLKDYLDDTSLLNDVDSMSRQFLQSAPSTVRRIFETAAGLAVIPIYLFFLLQSKRNFSRDLREQLTFLPASLREDIVFLTSEFAGIMVSFFHGRLLIGLIMGVLKATGFVLIGLKGGLLLGLFFGILNLVPYLGAALGLVVILPAAYFQPDGGWSLALEAGGVIAVVQMAEAYYITPKIMGERTGLHPMVIILAIFFWGTALHGLLGMIVGVPLTAFLVVVWRLVKTKYLPRHTQPPMRAH